MNKGMNEMKQTYYVSVQSASINQDQGATSYEFTIHATDKQVSKLQELFDERLKDEQHTFFRAHTPAVPYHDDEENDHYDETMRRIYSMIYDLGTSETQSHIDQMNIL